MAGQRLLFFTYLIFLYIYVLPLSLALAALGINLSIVSLIFGRNDHWKINTSNWEKKYPS